MYLAVGTMTISDLLSQTRSQLLPDGMLSAPTSHAHAGQLLLALVLLAVILPPVFTTAAWLLWIVVSILVGLSRAFYRYVREHGV